MFENNFEKCFSSYLISSAWVRLDVVVVDSPPVLHHRPGTRMREPKGEISAHAQLDTLTHKYEPPVHLARPVARSP